MYHFKNAKGKGSFKIAETRWGHKSGDYFECVHIYEGYNLGMDFLRHLIMCYLNMLFWIATG